MIGEHSTRPASVRARRLALAGALGLIAILMAGCIRFELTLSVEEDGSGELRVISAIAEEWAALAEGGLLTDDATSIHPSARSEEYDEGGFVGQSVTVQFADLDELDGVLATFFDGAGFVEQADDGTWLFSLTLGSTDELAAGFGGGGSGEELSAEMMDAFDLDESEVVIRVSLPGEPTEHNADRVEGGTLIWEPVLADGGPFEFSARSSPAGDDASGGSGGYALLAVVLLLAFAAGAVFISLRDRRRRSESGTDLTGGQE